MITFVQLLHIFLSFFLILIILLQPGKDSGAVFGGQSGNSAYAARTNANPLGRATTVVAVIFMSTSITLAYFSTPEVLEGSDGEETRKELQKRITKKDWRLKAPKLPNVEPSSLMKTQAPTILEAELDDATPADVENDAALPTEENTATP